MDHQTIELLRHYSERYNTAEARPNCKVEIYRMNRKGEYEPAAFTIPNVMEVSLDRRYNLSASELRVMISNNKGELSPDYSPYNRYDNVKGLSLSGFKNVLVPFNKIVLYLGYGEEMRTMFTGQIVDVSINENPPTISLTCKDMYRKLLKPIDPETKKALVYENLPAGVILSSLLKLAGARLYEFKDKTLDGKEYIIPKKVFNLGTQYSDAIKEIVEMLAHRVYCNRNGTIIIEPVKRYTQEESAKLELNDYVNLTSGEYNMNSTLIRNRVIIQANDGWKAFEDVGMIGNCNGEKISCAIESPWATDEEDGTPKRKQAVADRFFMDQRKKFRRIVIGAKGHPALDVGDLVRVRELVSTANSNYMITGIKTSYSPLGYIDIIDLEYVSADVHIATLAEGQYQNVDDVVGGGKVHMLTATDRDLVIDEVKQYIGKYYQHGGDWAHNKEDYGLDVPHFIFAVYEPFGLMIEFKPQQEIYTLCDPIEESELQKGDLVFYSDEGTPELPRNIAIYTGDGNVVVNRGGSSQITTLEEAKKRKAKVVSQPINYNGLFRNYMRLKTMKEGEK